MVLGMLTKSKRRRVLETLPTSLYNSFQGVITRIRGSNTSQAELGMKVLMWLHFAYRPLRLTELQHALAVEKGDAELDANNIPSQKVVLDCCLGLVLVDKETSTVRFVHYTLEEYFRKFFTAEFPNGYSSIAETCLTYLNFGKLRQHCTTDESLEENMVKYALLNYAALYWGTYVKQQCNDNLIKLALMIVNHESERPPCAIQALHKYLRPRKPGTWKFSGIHTTAYFGLGEIMAYFCKVGWYVELKDESYRTPLVWAAERGHEAVVRLLIERDDVDVNIKGDFGETPLFVAAGNGHEAIVRLLIERNDIDVKARGIYGWTPLYVAAKNGHEAIVRLLIERDDIDVDVKKNYGETPLFVAAWNGHEAVVRLLIERGDIDVNCKDIERWTPLYVAAMNGHEAVVRLLIGRDDIDVNIKNDFSKTPLYVAAENGHEAVVRLLIGRDDVDVNIKDIYGKTPLFVVAENGYEAVVRLLIEGDDVDVNVKDDSGKTPLLIAAKNGHESVVRLLIGRDDVDVNVKDRWEKTPLFMAANNGHEAVVRLLIGRDDVDVNIKDNSGKTPLYVAAKNGHQSVVRLLNDLHDRVKRDLVLLPERYSFWTIVTNTH